jgi:hypothetical protein
MAATWAGGGTNLVRDIDSIRARIEGTDLSPTGLPRMLDATWDAFDLLAAVCRQCEEQSASLFAAFAFASTAAVEGRHCITAAPSLPRESGTTTSHAAAVPSDLEAVADTLAGLAGMLSEELSSAADHAGDPGDRAACAAAARHASQIRELLARDP